jgi:predicted transcriptional regulator
MSVKVTEEEILFLLNSENRKKIMRYLRTIGNDYASTTEISEKIGMKSGKVGFHCNELNKWSFVDKKIVAGKANWRISEKGLSVLTEVDKRETGKNGKKQVDKHVR